MDAALARTRTQEWILSFSLYYVRMWISRCLLDSDAGDGFLLLVCWSLPSWQHIGTCQDVYRILTMHINPNFIALPHLETRMPTPPHSMIQSYCPHTELTRTCPILVMPVTRLGSDKCRLYVIWFYSIRNRTFVTFNIGREVCVLAIRPPCLVGR